MRKHITIFTAVLVLSAIGCTTGSHVTLGPLHAQSDVTTHVELQEPGFYFAEDRKDGLCSGSSLALWSSEICADWRENNGLSAGAFINWAQTSE